MLPSRVSHLAAISARRWRDRATVHGNATIGLDIYQDAAVRQIPDESQGPVRAPVARDRFAVDRLLRDCLLAIHSALDPPFDLDQ